MWQRFTLYDLRVIGHYLGTLILFSSLMMVVPFVTALVCCEWEPASRYLISIGVTLIVGSSLRFLRIEPGHLSRRQALTVTGLAWLVLALIGTIPLYLSGHYLHYADALFDAVSGITTTGISVIYDQDHLSNADNMFRFMQLLFGGLGIIVIALSFGLFGKEGGASMYASEARSEHVVPNVVQTTRFIAKISIDVILIATIIITTMCVFMGMEPMRAVLQSFWLSITAFVTGGFAPMSQSAMYYHSVFIDIVLMMLMLLGTVNFVIQSETWHGRIKEFFRDIETRTMILWLAVTVCVFAAACSASTSFSSLAAMLHRGLFMVISAFSTTGLQTITSNQLTTALPSGAFLMLAILMAVGGGVGSTSGGVKLRRVGVIAMSVVGTIKETLAPDSARVAVTYHHLGRSALDPNVAKEALTVFALYAITYVVGAMVGLAHGYEATQAIFESVAVASNGGISTGIVAPGMPITLEAFYIFEMWAGRLEFVTLLALIVELVVSVTPKRRVRKR